MQNFAQIKSKKPSLYFQTDGEIISNIGESD